MQRVEDVLGKGWESHIDGQQLKQDGDSFRQKLNSQVLFDEWKKNVESKQHVVQGKIFQIASQRTRTGTLLKLQVNFAPETITLAKEVCMRVCVYIHVCLTSIYVWSVHVYVCMFVYLYVYTRVYIHVCVPCVCGATI